jgi:nicotinamidase-related amidase
VTTAGLNQPEPVDVKLPVTTTAIAVLDLSVRCDKPDEICSELMAGLGAFLDRARRRRVPIIFTSSFSAKGTPEAEIATALKRRPDEPVIYPDAFDKFVGAELQTFLTGANARQLIIVGSSTHVAVLYTATTAARVYGYQVVIPLDGVNTRNPIEHDYALHQLTVIPRASTLIRFSMLGSIQFTERR